MHFVETSRIRGLKQGAGENSSFLTGEETFLKFEAKIYMFPEKQGLFYNVSL